MENTINMPVTIIKTINTIFSNFISSLDINIYSILDDIIFINSDILNDSFMIKILGISPTSGLLLLCNSLLFGFVLYYIISLILSHIIIFKIQTPYQFICKLIIISILINYTHEICGFLLNLNSNISWCIRSIGENLFNSEICFSTLLDKISAPLYEFNMFSIQGFLKSFSSIGILNLVLSYSLRYIMIKVFIFLFPFAIISFLNESTSYFLKSYIKSFISLLFVQSIVSLILLLIFSLDFSSNQLFFQIIFIGAIYALSRANYFVKELMGGITTTVYSNATNLKTLFKGGI